MSTLPLRAAHLINAILWLGITAAAVLRNDVVSVILAIMGMCASAVIVSNNHSTRQRIAVMKHTIAMQDAHLERIRQHRGSR